METFPPTPLALSPPISHITHTGLCRHLEQAKFVGRHTTNSLFATLLKTHTINLATAAAASMGAQQKEKQKSRKNLILSNPRLPTGENLTVYSIFLNYFFGLPELTT